MTDLAAAIAGAVDEDRLVRTAAELIAIPSFTGSEQACAEYLTGELTAAGMEAELQSIEPGRANAVGRLPGAGGGPALMFNGHLDTSYSGEEPWLEGPGYKPNPVMRDGVILGLGIMNMKGAVACYVEAVRALRDAGVRLAGDLIVAGVAGEIEKAEWGEYTGAEYRGYGVGTRHLMAEGVTADACILGEPTEQKVVLGHFGTIWARISTAGPFMHTAFVPGRLAENSIIRMQDVVEAVAGFAGEWEERARYHERRGALNIAAINGGFPWRASRTPHRTDLFIDMRVPPTMPLAEAEAAFAELVETLRAAHPEAGITSEIYVSVPGAEIAESHPVIAAIDAGHAAAFGGTADRDHVRWGSDASTLSRRGIASVNYGPIAGALPGPEGESVPIQSLVGMATSYAVAAANYCEGSGS
ncbi:MAG: M20/M25/M40 family metallo-hydrolase [Acidimicrobiia bacterium]|nr:M20/M25/M40 family metallo-hydrolase [Acidimicrobiia bacterium]NNF10622.1 M20/M25/M40 family metallo-hydrolase [Acidimicrobiia bacterium]NNL69680.1 M20/M25/M40 family metallo-hydrolase [Acidimicrobiia bacterium]